MPSLPAIGWDTDRRQNAVSHYYRRIRINIAPPKGSLDNRSVQHVKAGSECYNFVVIMVKCGNILNYIEIISRQMRHTVPRIVFNKFDFLCILAEILAVTSSLTTSSVLAAVSLFSSGDFVAIAGVHRDRHITGASNRITIFFRIVAPPCSIISCFLLCT